MAFDWGTDVSQAVEDAINRLDDYNSSNFNPVSNPQGLAGGGHISNFPAALTDTATTANGFKAFADLIVAYANSASASAISASQAVANLSGTSTSSVALSSGSKSFATQSGKSWPAGTILLLSSDANPTTHWLALQVTSYSGTALQGDVKQFSGSGSRADWTIRVTGYPGRSGGLAYLWTTSTTNADPGSGRVKMNAAPGSASALYISETDFDANALGGVLATWDDSTSSPRGRVFISSVAQPANFAIVDITSPVTDNGTWDAFAVTPVAAGGTLADGAMVNILFAPAGNPGSTGPTGASYAATSTSSLVIGTGSKAFTTQTGLAYQVGTRARATDAANTANWMEGIVSAYTGATLTILCDLTSGSGTIANWNISVAGERGTGGATGSAGDDAGFEFQFNTATSGDPGLGKFGFNNATFASATSWAISETDNNGLGIGPLLAALDDGTGANKILVFVIKQGGSAFFSFFVTAALTDQGAYDTFNITPNTTAGTIANNDTFHIIAIPLEVGPAGATGAPGPTTAPVWTFDSGTTAVDPGTNEFALNNASAASATTLYINETGPGAANMAAFIASWDDSTNSTHRGTLFVIQTTDPSKYAIFTVGTVTDSGAYDSIAITYVAGPGGFTAGQACAFSFTRSGNAGAGSGDIVGPASATNNGIVLFDGATGKLVKSSAAVGALAYLASVGNSQIDANAVSLDKLATQGAGTVLANVTGGVAVPTAAAITTTFKTALALTATDVGLGSVNNTSDANKPISTATQAALDLRSHVRVRAVATSNITIATALNNADSLDGVTLATNDLVLVAGQSSQSENGIYVVGVTPIRHTDYDAFGDYPGLLVVVAEGTSNSDSLWLSTANAGGTIGSTALPFLQQGGPSGAGGRAVLAATDEAGVQTAAGLVIGTNVQAADALLTSIAALPMVADRFIYGTGTDVVTIGTITTAGRALIDDTDASAQLTTLGVSAYGKTLIDDADASTALSTLGFSTFGKTIIDDANGAAVLATIGAVGKQAIPIPAGGMTPATTNGPSSGNLALTNQQFVTKDFDTTTQETVYFPFRMPQQWDEGTLTFQVTWSHPATTTNFGAVFELAAVGTGDNEAGDAAFGTAQTVTDTGGTTNQIYISPESAAITPAGTIAPGDYLWLRLRRVPANASDTLAVDARVHEVTLFMTNNAGTDV